MSEEQELVVNYKRESADSHYLSLGCQYTQDIRIDYTGVEQDQRGGTATRLVAGAALYCFASTLGMALTVRGANIKSLTGRAIAAKGMDERHRAKVTKIRIEIDVDLDEEDLAILERCKKVMQEGCLITHSLDTRIQVEHSIRWAEPGASDERLSPARAGRDG